MKPILVTPGTLWDNRYRSLIIFDKDAEENEEIKKLIDAFKAMARGTGVKWVTLRNKPHGTTGSKDASKKPDMIQKSAPDSAGIPTTSKPTNPRKKTSSKNTPKQRRLSREEVLLIRALYNAGKSFSEIRHFMNLPKNTVRYVVLGVNYSNVK